MAITDKIVTKERLQYFKGKLDANGYKNVIEKIKLNGTSQSVDQTDKSVNLFLPTWDFDHGAMSYQKSVALALRTEDGQGTRKAMALSIDNAANPQKVMVGVWGNLDTEMYHAEVPTIAAMNEAIETNGGKIDKIKVNGTEQTITNKEVDLTVPTMNGSAGDFTAWNGKTDPGERTSIQIVMSRDDYVEVQTKMADGNGTATETLTHNLVDKTYVDRTFRTQQQVQDAIDDALADVSGVDFSVVASYEALPATGTKGVFYLVPNAGAGQNVYDEYVWLNSGTAESPNYHYEKIGTTAVDLTGYVQEDDLNEITTAEIDAMFA